MQYLGVAPAGKKFEPTLFKRERMLAEGEEIAHQNRGTEVNRLGVLLGNKACDQTKTLTHVLWSLLNSIPANSVQRPHRHNSVALTWRSRPSRACTRSWAKRSTPTATSSTPSGATGPPEGCSSRRPGGGTRTTMRATRWRGCCRCKTRGLYTHQRTLDIRFVDDELALHKAGKIRGSAFAVTCRQYTEMVESRAGPHEKKRGMKRVWSAEKDVATAR